MKRLFIIDPVCANSYGHNLGLMLRYKKYLNQFNYYDKIYLVSSFYATAEDSLIKSFDFYYSEVIHIDNYDETLDLHIGTRYHIPKHQDSSSKIEKIKYETSIHDALCFLEDNSITENDTLFFPGIDFYTAVGFCGAIAKLYSSNQSPRLIIRFIGVMENVCTLHPDPKSLLFLKIRELLTANYKIKLAAETPKYADYIAQKTGTVVSVTPHPIVQSKNTKKNFSNKFVVSSPGSGRIDKGYDRLLHIIKGVYEKNPLVQFVIQSPPPKIELQLGGLASQLYAFPNVHLLPSSLSANQMTQMYLETDLVILPYDSDIYALRGSASLVEALEHGSLVLSSKGTAFESQVNYYGIGSVCETNAEFVSQIIRYSTISYDHYFNRINQSMFRLKSDMTNAYKELFRV